MSERRSRERFSSRPHRIVHLVGYLFIFAVGVRRINELDGVFSISLALTLLGIFTILYASEQWISRKYSHYPHIYMAVQTAIIQLLGAFQVYIDTWVILYVVLGFQVANFFSRREAGVWWGLFMASTLVTLSIEFGLISGLGRALAYIAIGVFFISYDIQFAQYEATLAESQVLLHELQLAHQQLETYASQAIKLAAAQERSRIVQELYDSVGQKIFAIQLSVEATRLLYDKDPAKAADQLDMLQRQTQTVLDQMRQWIGFWRQG